MTRTPTDPIADLAKLLAPTRFHVHPRWKEAGYTHAFLPKELPLNIGGFEVVEDLWCPMDIGLLLYPCGKVVTVRFAKGATEGAEP